MNQSQPEGAVERDGKRTPDFSLGFLLSAVLT